MINHLKLTSYISVFLLELNYRKYNPGIHMTQFFLDFNIKECSQSISNENSSTAGRKSIRTPNRLQVEFKMESMDDLLPGDHRARDIWDYVVSLDLKPFYSKIKIGEGFGGPRTVDPRVLLALWLYAMLEGVASARHIANLSKMHYAYIWICGGVSVNYHTLSDFRTQDPENFRMLLQESIALMWKTGKFKPETAAQDGTRIKADAGTSSARREPTLEQYLVEAQEYLKTLEEEHTANPSASTLREKAARQRAALERKERLEQAQSEMKKYKQERIHSAKKNHDSLSQADLEKTRVSVTDPECRKMKMGDGGFRLAYNVQFATSTDKQVILGVDVVNTLDPGTLAPMMQQVKKTLDNIGCTMPSKWLADSAYANKADTEAAEVNFSDICLYSPPTGNGKVDALTPRKTDNAAMINLRERMSTEESKVIYKERSQTAEFANAVVKNRGMGKVLVRGLSKVTSMTLLYAVAHNMAIYLRTSV
jgi:transposase